MVRDYINIMKTTLDFNFNLYKAFKQHGYTKTWKQKEAIVILKACLKSLVFIKLP